MQYLDLDATKLEIFDARARYLSRDARETLIWAGAHGDPQHRAEAITRANREERNHRLRTGLERHVCIDPGCDFPQEIAGRCLPCAKAYAD